MADVFVSYAREDEARVSALVRLLEAQGLSVFWDRNIPAGETWREHIGQALAQSSCVLVAWSTHSIASAFVAEEADEGRHRGVLVPVLIDAVSPPLGFRSLQAADLQDLGARTLPRGFEPLLAAIKAALAESPRASASPAVSKAAAPAAAATATIATTATTAAAAHGARRAVVPVGMAALLLGSAWAYQFIAGRSAVPADAAMSVPAEVQRPGSTQAVGTSVDVLDRWATPNGGLGLRVQVTQRGAAPITVSAGSAFALVRRSAAVESPVESRPLFETLQRDDPVVFELRFASADGTSLRVSLYGEPQQVVDLPAPR